jgi:membrane-bound lytic murein transglycosylase MltF
MNIHNFLKQAKKELIYLLIIIILIVVFANYLHSNDSEEQQEVTSLNEIVVLSDVVESKLIYTEMNNYYLKAPIVSTAETKPADDIDNFPYFEDIPLSEEVQRYIYETAEEYSISYELVLAIAKVESNYDPSVIAQGRDKGLYQLNSDNTLDWAAEMAGIENFEWDNPKHSAKAAINYLSWLREYWLDKGYSEEDVFAISTMSYNMGIGNMQEYINRNGIVPNAYLNKVYNAKTELEMEGGEF